MTLTAERICNLIVGTAGHIDHGKTSLIKVLTGIDADRLQEEKERGMTIDLGFASLELPDGRRVGFLDVPGHEKFVKNMVAGSTSMDLVLLVIAADDGPMPQTREHLEIMNLLEVKRGIVALTKIDLVDAELLEIQHEVIREMLQDTFLADAEICPLSTQTGEGVEEFKEKMFKVIAGTQPRVGHGPFRMPIQRVFSAQGHGAVLTGIPLAGRVDKGSPVVVLPQGYEGKVRSIQAYFQDAENARTGHSSALNISDVDYKKVERGNLVAAPGNFQPTTRIDVHLRYLKSAKRALKDRVQVRFHSGTFESVGTLVLLDAKQVAPGGEAFAQVVLEHETVVVPGDRYILRWPSPALTLGGGRVLWTNSGKLKRMKEGTSERCEHLRSIVDDPKARVLFALEERGFHPTSAIELKPLTGLLPEDLAKYLDEWVAEGGALVLGKGRQFLSAKYAQRAQEKIFEYVSKQLTKDKSLVGVELNVVKSRFDWNPTTFNEALSALTASGRLKEDGNLLKLPGREITLSPEEARARDRVLEELNKAPYSPPTHQDLEKMLGDKGLSQRVMKMLTQTGEIVRIGGVFSVTKATWDDAVARLREALADGEGRTSADLKTLFESSRKYIIPLFEAIDDAGITVRRGDQRFLKK